MLACHVDGNGASDTPRGSGDNCHPAMKKPEDVKRQPPLKFGHDKLPALDKIVLYSM
jgi:hypothetical protein